MRAGDEAARAASSEIVQATIGYGDTRQRRAHRQLARRPRVRRPHAHALRRPGRGPPRRRHPDRPRDRRRQRRLRARGRGDRPPSRPDAPPRRRTIMLDSKPAPVGAMPVVLANGFGGTLFHEACGHGLEADAIAKGASIYDGKLGEVVAADIVSAYDDGSITNGWGSQAFDDEGVPTQKTMVIEDGRLHRLPLRPPAGAPGGRRPHGQRAAPVVPPRAHPAHDDDVHRRPATPAARRSSRRRPRASTPRAWPAGRSSRPAATSSSASPRAI